MRDIGSSNRLVVVLKQTLKILEIYNILAWLGQMFKRLPYTNFTKIFIQFALKRFYLRSIQTIIVHCNFTTLKYFLHILLVGGESKMYISLLHQG
jgi:hypothetical protein